MPRMGRVVLPGYPHHIVQRGHDRNVVFASTSDYRYYLETLVEFKDVFCVRVYAYCLMTNHVHLLLSPSDHKGLGLLMKRLAGRQTRYRNKLEGRSGTLWESRYRSSVVNVEQYLLACVRYIELNPVRAKIVEKPGDYAWSSFAARVGNVECSWLDPFPGIDMLISGREGNTNGYASYIESAIPEGEWELIRLAVRRGQLTGDTRFTEAVQKVIGRRIEYRGQGRPLKHQKNKSVPI